MWRIRIFYALTLALSQREREFDCAVFQRKREFGCAVSQGERGFDRHVLPDRDGFIPSPPGGEG